MLAAVLKDFDDLVLEDVPVPEPGPGEVVVRIRACGFCATDYKAIRGIRRNVRFPAILGHEPAGVVHTIGEAVEQFRKGDEVICQPSGYCGLCRHCRAGDTHYCEHAFTTGGDGPEEVWPGAFAEYMKTKATCLLHKPAGISFDVAALCEPLSGVWKGLIQKSQLEVGEDVVIIGTGGIGLLCVMVELRRRGTRWNVFGITTHETFELDGGRTHFLEGRMDASFGTTPLAMLKAIRLMETGLVDPEKIISHRFPLSQIHQAVETMAAGDRGKVMVNP